MNKDDHHRLFPFLDLQPIQPPSSPTIQIGVLRFHFKISYSLCAFEKLGVVQYEGFLLEREHLISLDRPLSKFRYVAGLDSFNQLEIANTTNIRTSAACFYLASF